MFFMYQTVKYATVFISYFTQMIVILKKKTFYVHSIIYTHVYRIYLKVFKYLHQFCFRPNLVIKEIARIVENINSTVLLRYYADVIITCNV